MVGAEPLPWPHQRVMGVLSSHLSAEDEEFGRRGAGAPSPLACNHPVAPSPPLLCPRSALTPPLPQLHPVGLGVLPLPPPAPGASREAEDGAKQTDAVS